MRPCDRTCSTAVPLTGIDHKAFRLAYLWFESRRCDFRPKEHLVEDFSASLACRAKDKLLIATND